MEFLRKYTDWRIYSNLYIDLKRIYSNLYFNYITDTPEFRKKQRKRDRDFIRDLLKETEYLNLTGIDLEIRLLYIKTMRLRHIKCVSKLYVIYNALYCSREVTPEYKINTFFGEVRDLYPRGLKADHDYRYYHYKKQFDLRDSRLPACLGMFQVLDEVVRKL